MQLLPIEFAVKAVLIAVGTAGVLRILNVKTAAARHAAWAGVVVVMLLLPVWTVWGPKVAWHLLPPLAEQRATHAIATVDAFEPAAGSLDVRNSEDSTLVPQHAEWNWTACLLGIYLVGVAVFLARLTLGTLQAQLLVRRAFHRGGRSFSGACGAPVTVGWLRPVVVLPDGWFQWPAAQLDAVLTHEHEHARRRDPLFQWLALLNRAVFWFHPLAWWLERRIAALAEEACDAVVLAHGHDPRDYSKYLIDMARSVASSGARIQVWGMAMPGGFLEERIRRILEGDPLPQVSRARLVCACIACAATSAAFATSTLDHQRRGKQPDQKVVPAQAQANSSNGNRAVPGNAVQNLMLAQRKQQAPTGLPAPVVISDGMGVRVSGADRIMHRNPVEYPADARTKGIEGTVILDLVLAPDGTVSDATVIGGPMELRKAALSSVLTWHFSTEAAPRQQVSVEFSLKAQSRGGGSGVFRVGGGVTAPTLVLEPVSGAPAVSSQAADLNKPEVLLRLLIHGLSQAAEEELRTRLQLKVGQTIDDATFQRAREVVRQFDDNLRLGRTWVNTGTTTGGVWLTVSLPEGGSVRPEHGPASASGNSLSDVPRRLHVDIQDLSPEAAAELRQRLAVREGETLDHAAFVKELERIHQIIREFDPHLNDSKAMGKVQRKVGADGKVLPPDSMDVTVIISSRDSALQPAGFEQYAKVAKAPSLENVPIKLHVEIQGLSPEAAADLRQRLAVREGETTDSEALKKTVVRIRQVMKEFDPRLMDEMHFDFPPRKFGADGKPIPWDSVGATMIIKR